MASARLRPLPQLSYPSHKHLNPLFNPTQLLNNMSDAGRRDLTDQIGSNLKPDSQKSILEQGKEKLDSAASSLQPESQKSTTQKIGDSVSGNSNENQDSLLSKAKQTLGLDNSKST
ncbi:hypothetical protein OC846_003359 [Tilletia horrida]|uniref:Uncharacterized protein n=1 Tax=Tilletia horrida TaxID=155126 RepID=A0AAN6GQJ3_9BASI|nr:hypothetical protein OC846_003359 [Tilletia horrida]KAK0563632.1 hypothetical protein OC861_004697 [Tilletia horrida]